MFDFFEEAPDSKRLAETPLIKPMNHQDLTIGPDLMFSEYM